MSAGSFYQQIEAQGDGLPPVDKWHPPLSGEMDCIIRKDGSWEIDGGKLEKPRLLRLLSKVLKCEDGCYFLVSPVEKWLIQVEDLPFLVVELDIRNPATADQSIHTRTNVGDWTQVDNTHPLGTSPLGGTDNAQVIPYVNVRDSLSARFNRNTFLELAEYLLPTDSADQYTLLSAGDTFTLRLDDQ